LRRRTALGIDGRLGSRIRAKIVFITYAVAVTVAVVFRVTSITDTIGIKVLLIGIGHGGAIILVVANPIIVGIIIANVANTIAVGIGLVAIGYCGAIITAISHSVAITVSGLTNLTRTWIA
jgi:hypothetical protein